MISPPGGWVQTTSCKSSQKEPSGLAWATPKARNVLAHGSPGNGTFSVAAMMPPHTREREPPPLIGGGSRSRVWTGMIAATLNVPLHRSTVGEHVVSFRGGEGWPDGCHWGGAGGGLHPASRRGNHSTRSCYGGSLRVAYRAISCAQHRDCRCGPGDMTAPASIAIGFGPLGGEQ